MREFRRTHLFAVAAGLAVSGLCGCVAQAQLLFSTEQDYAAWTPTPGGIQPDFVRYEPGVEYNGLASGAPGGPGAIGYPGAFYLAPPPGQSFAYVQSQNFINNTDTDSALLGADYIQVDISGSLENVISLVLFANFSINDYTNVILQESPSSWVNQGSYWTATYPDPIYFTSTDPGTYLQLGFETSSATLVSDIRVVPPAWNNAAGGDWNTYGNWTTADTMLAPNRQGLEADFLVAITSNETVTTSETVNIGTILLNNSGASYTLSATGSGNITMNMPGVEPAAINDQGGTHFISAPLILDSNTNVTVANSGDVLHLSGGISGAGGLAVNGSGTVSLESANSYGGATTVNSGTLSVAIAGALSATTSLTIGTNTTSAEVRLVASTGGQSISGLTINSGSALDLTNNHIIIDYAADTQAMVDAAIRQYLINGRNGGPGQAQAASIVPAPLCQPTATTASAMPTEPMGWSPDSPPARSK